MMTCYFTGPEVFDDELARYAARHEYLKGHCMSDLLQGCH